MKSKAVTYKKSDIAFLRAQNRKKPVSNPPKLISEYMEGRRRMPDGSPFPGIYSIHRTPYAIEPLDNMSPFSGIRNTAVMKPVQSGGTSNFGENIIAYYIGARPAKIMYMSGTDALLKKFVNGRFDPLIDSCGFRPLIRSQSLKKNNRKTGDLAEYKEYPGGTLTLGSLQSEAAMRQESVMIMIRDEISLVEIKMSSGEGNRLKVSDGRTAAFDESGRVKIFDYSTPTVSGLCLIEQQYLKGDQRKYFIKCPLCGKRQYLHFGDEKTKHGLKGDYKAGKIQNAYYLCYHCHDALFNYQKDDLLQSGIWQPTAEPISIDFRSYQYNAMYSPMLSWLTIKKEWDSALDEGEDALATFTNLYMGEPSIPSGEKPSFQSVIEIRSRHISGEVPQGILYLTMATDVQRGKDIYKKYENSEILEISEKAKKEGDFKKLEGLPRLECEVVGHGWDFRTASIIYKVFYGHTRDSTTGAWRSLAEWMVETSLVFKRKDGFEFQVQRTLIDSGDGMFMDVSIAFCGGWAKTYPLKGRNPLKQDKMKTGMLDEPTRMDYVRYTKKRSA
ncbi:MAG: phage terminase large subunit family protein [Reinekea sp.]